MAIDTIRCLQMEVAEILDRITDSRDWIQATESLKEMIEVTEDANDYEFAYRIWIGIYSNLYPA